MRPWIIGLLVCVLGILVSGAIFLFRDWGTTENDLKFQNDMLFELFSFSMTTILVGGAAIFYGAYRDKIEKIEAAHRDDVERRDQAAKIEDHKKEKAERDEDLRLSLAREKQEEFLSRFTATYNNTKLIRRELRHQIRENLRDTFEIQTDNYRSKMKELNQAQLEFEQFRRMLESQPGYLQALSDYRAILGDAEEYLRSVTTEYEQQALDVSNGGDCTLVPTESKLFQFTVSRSSKHFRRQAFSRFFGPLDQFYKALYRHIGGHRE